MLASHRPCDLLNSIRQVLNEAILRNGASIDWVYRGGDFQNYFRAYDREGQPCLECGTPIHTDQSWTTGDALLSKLSKIIWVRGDLAPGLQFS